MIDLKDRYPCEVFPSLWTWLDRLAEEGRLRMCEQACDECDDPPLKEFIKRHTNIVATLASFEGHFRSLQSAESQLGLRLTNPQAARTQADPFVVALALMLDGRDASSLQHKDIPQQRCHVLSEEKRSGGGRKIPDACDALDLGHVTIVEFLRAEGYRG